MQMQNKMATERFYARQAKQQREQKILDLMKRENLEREDAELIISERSMRGAADAYDLKIMEDKLGFDLEFEKSSSDNPVPKVLGFTGTTAHTAFTLPTLKSVNY